MNDRKETIFFLLEPQLLVEPLLPEPEKPLGSAFQRLGQFVFVFLGAQFVALHQPFDPVDMVNYAWLVWG